jgi:lipopolysaccharide export LptBFGC system permease protein LptF
MNKLILILSVCILGIISCNESAKEKVDEAAAQVSETKADLTLAKEGFKQEIENYRVATIDKILSNDTVLTNYKLKVADEKTTMKKNYEKKLKLLEDKNFELKNRVNSYVANDKANWDEFKTQCDKDVNCMVVDINKMFKVEK